MPVTFFCSCPYTEKLHMHGHYVRAVAHHDGAEGDTCQAHGHDQRRVRSGTILVLNPNFCVRYRTLCRVDCRESEPGTENL